MEREEAGAGEAGGWVSANGAVVSVCTLQLRVNERSLAVPLSG